MHISTPRSNLLVRFMSVFLLFYTSAFAEIDQTGKQKVTVIANDAPLESVFKQIEKQTGLRFMYANDAVDLRDKVSASFEKVALDDVLGEVVGKRGLEWLYRDGVISLKRVVPDAPKLDVYFEKPITLRGRVMDEKGTPIPGATIKLKGQLKGTTSDENGHFVLEDVPEGAMLEISNIGYKPKETKATAKGLMIYLAENINNLDATIVRGYYKEKERFRIGNATTVTAAEIERQPVSDPLLALQGRVPGMIITQTTGVQGGEVRVQIRGRNSLRSGVVPLFVIDGIPYAPNITAPAISNFGAIGNILSTLNFINPKDIETIDILKDADATAIYGSRGANGVILITTKKGRSGKTRVDVNFSRGSSRVASKISLMNTKEYLQMRNEAFRNDNVVPSAEIYDLGYAPDLKLWDTTRYTNWQKMLLGRSASYMDLQGSVTGGNESLQYIIGGNYHRESTVYPGEFSSKNGGAHFNITGSSSNGKLRTSITGTYSVRTTNFPGVDFAKDVTLPPNAPQIYDANGRLNWENSTWQNPYSNLVSKLLNANTSNLVSSIGISYSPLQGMTISSNLGYNQLRNDNFSARTIAGIDPQFQSFSTATSTYLNSESDAWNFEPQASYAGKLFTGKIDVLVGATFLGSSSGQQTVIAMGIKDDALILNPAAASNYFVRDGESRYKYLAFFGRISYNLNDKYLINFTARRDGSSRFGPRNQFASFGAAAAGWIFSEEKFISKMLPVLSYGKLRVSYGTSGNDQIGDYQYLDRYDFQMMDYQDVKGLNIVGMFNADFSWELTKKSEVGIEMGFFKDNRVFISTSYYRNRSSRQLVGYQLPSMTGAASIVGNLPAVIQNAGLELLITSKNIVKKDIEWTTSFNWSLNRNRLVSFSGMAGIYARVGKSLSTVDVFQYGGVDRESGAYLFLDGNGKPGTIDKATRTGIVDITPRYSGGIQNFFRFKNLQLDIFFQYIKQLGASGVFDPSSIPGMLKNQSRLLLSRWQKNGDISDYQKFSQNYELLDPYFGALSSDKGYEDASFIRCKNISISWQLPSDILRRMNVQNCRVYVQAQNLFTITKYSGWDPETQSIIALPPLRTITFGAQIAF